MTHHLRGMGGKVEDVVAPWNKPNLRSLLLRGEEGRAGRLEARISAEVDRAISKILHQHVLPELESRSDVVIAGVMMVLHYAKLHGRDSSDFRNCVNHLFLETEIRAATTYFDRMSKSLDDIEENLKSAKEHEKKHKFNNFYRILTGIKDIIEDEELSSRAKKLWVLHREHAKKCQEKGVQGV